MELHFLVHCVNINLAQFLACAQVSQNMLGIEIFQALHILLIVLFMKIQTRILSESSEHLFIK